MKLHISFCKTVLVSAVLVFAGLQFAAGQPLFGSVTPSIVSANANLAAVGSGGSFDGALAYVIAGGYVVMFVGMVLEGPMITAAAAFGASLGYFDIFVVFLLAILGDIVGDVAYYAVGYISRVAFVEKYGHRFGMSKERMKKLERLLRTHPGKTLLVIKTTGIATPGLMMVGAVRMPIKKFTSVCLSIILPKVLLFVLLGYYFGQAYTSVAKYVQNAEYFIVAAVVATACIYYAYNKLSATVGKRLETI